YQSANCTVNLSTNGIATFTFNDINLPYASANPTTSNGLFTYTVHMKPGLAAGTQIHNRAAIYFDYNAPVITNSTLNTIQNNVGVANVNATAASFSLYPNPATMICNIAMNNEVAGTADMKVTDITGKVMLIN